VVPALERFQESWSPAFLLGLDPGIGNATTRNGTLQRFRETVKWSVDALSTVAVIATDL